MEVIYLKEFEVDISYNGYVEFTTTIKVKAKTKKEAEKHVKKNLFQGKDYMNKAKWEQDYDQLEEPEVQDVREIGN